MGREGARRITSPIVVGRDDESRVLDLALGDAVAARPRVVVVGGEAGVGKSRLVDEFATRARATGARVVVGGCLPSGALTPFLPFVEMLRQLVRDLPPGRRESILGPARTQLARVMPELGRPPDARPGTPRSLRETTGFERLQLLEGLLEVAERLGADAPTVFVLEDAHWADGDSLGLVAYMTRNLRRARVMLVVVTRTDEPGGAASPLVPFLAELERTLSVDRVELAPLSRRETARQVEAIVQHRVEPDRLERIFRLGGGNPFYTEELLASSEVEAGAALSPRLRDVLRARIAHLPSETREVLRVASVAGRALDDRILAAASGMPAAALGRGLRAAVAEHVLIAAEGSGTGAYRFRHELLRAAVASELLPGERARLHAGMAIALADSAGAAGGPGEIAFHWDSAGEPSRALPAHVEAAIAAERACSFVEAQRHFERALALWDHVRYADDLVGLDHPALAERTAGAAAAAGDLPRAIELGRAILASPDAASDADLRDRVRAGLQWHLWESGAQEAALTEVVETLRHQPRAGVSHARATALAQHAGLLMLAGRTAGARREATVALRMGRSLPAPEVEALALGVLGWCLVRAGHVDDAVESLRAAWTIALDAGDPAGQALAYNELASVLDVCGRTDEGLEVALQGRDHAVSRGLGRTMGALLESTAVRALYELGRWHEAERRAVAALEGGAVGPGRLGLLVARALLCTGAGRFADAGTALCEARADAGGSTDRQHLGWLEAAAAELALWHDDAPEALSRVAGALWPDAPDAKQGTPTLAIRDVSTGRLLALAARASAEVSLEARARGRPVEPGLLRMAEALRRAAAGPAARIPGVRPDILAARAEMDRCAGQGPARQVRDWEAAASAAHGNRPYAESYARWRLAEALLGGRMARERAIREIHAAHALAMALGAGPLGREIELLARRARVPLASGAGVTAQEPPRAEIVAFGLTPRELSVLALLANGRTNREIAGRLYISPKTASVHVSSILGKLGVDGRVAAATLAQRLGLAGAAEDADRSG